MYIAVDFDGTIVDHAYPDIGKPNPDAIFWMQKWNDMGGKLILFTMRDNETLEMAVEYLTNEGIELYGINENPDQRWSTSRKVYADVYVDDMAFGCPLRTIPTFNRVCVDWDSVGPNIHYKLLS